MLIYTQEENNRATHEAHSSNKIRTSWEKREKYEKNRNISKRS